MGNKCKLSSRRASFLKVLDGDFSNKLTIPRTFIRTFNGDVPHWFILEIAGTRKGWRIDTAEDENGQFCLDYGWNEFVEEQSLHGGDFLLFQYEEPLILQVKIFEQDGTEKTSETNTEPDYEVEGLELRVQSPIDHRVGEADLLWSRRPGIELMEEVEHEKSQDVSDGIEMETADQCGMHEKQQEQDVVNRIEMETDYGYDMNEQLQGNNDMSVSKLHDENDTLMKTDVRCREHEKQLEGSDRTEKGRGKVFATEQGFCYAIRWRNVPHLYYHLTLPRSIVKGKTLFNDETVILKDQGGNTWPMKLRERPGGRVDLVSGWREFVDESDVRNGDILTFEFRSDKVIHIYIEGTPQIDLPSITDLPSKRAHKMEPTVSSEKPWKEPAVDYETVNHNVPETKGKMERVIFDNFTRSTFYVAWKHTTKGSYLHIPKAIAREQKLENKDKVVVCDPEGKKWPMMIRTRPSDGRVGLGEGWSIFRRRHKISNGDTLFFEFVSDHVMTVNIIKALPAQPSPNAGPAMKQQVMMQL